MEVYVVGYEANDTGAISFWDWYLLKESAAKRKTELENNPHCSTGVIYNGEVALDSSVDINDKESITFYVEKFLHDNDWENAFSS